MTEKQKIRLFDSIYKYYSDIWRNRSKLRRQNYYSIIMHTSFLVFPSLLYLAILRANYRLEGIFTLVIPPILWIILSRLKNPISSYETATVAQKSHSGFSGVLFKIGNKIGNWSSINNNDKSKISSVFLTSNHYEIHFFVLGTLFASIILIIL